ncbi:MAG: hypothetical protein R3B60_03365 [Candidatus Paceibacterota bacterium]
MENRSHVEPLESRIARFQDGHPIEIISTLLNSIDNHFNNEIRLATENDHYQTSLLFLGIHAVSLTISEGLFNTQGEAGYKMFLENYIDGDTPDTKFSNIATEIHSWRNILAHQWLGVSGYDIGYDYEQEEGWIKRDDVVFINPKIYSDHYLNAFVAGGSIWDFDKRFTEDELQQIKERLLVKFLAR